MTDRIISLDAAIEAVLNIRHAAAGNFAPEFSGNQGEAYDRAVLDIHKALSTLPAVDGWLDIAGIPDAQQVEVLMQDCECGQFVMLATLYDRDMPMSFVNEDGDYFPPDQNGCWPTHFRLKTWPLPAPLEIE